MKVKKLLKRLMTKATKTLNVSEDVHKRLKLAATQEGEKIADYAEAAIEVGLSKPREIKRLLEDRTKQEPPQGTK